MLSVALGLVPGVCAFQVQELILLADTVLGMAPEDKKCLANNNNFLLHRACLGEQRLGNMCHPSLFSLMFS